MADVRDVAAAIMDSVEECTTMKLQKLLYYCQGWHLAWCGVPLFDDDIEAWADGPVVRKVYNRHPGRRNLSAPWPGDGDVSRLSPNEAKSVRLVLDTYGNTPAEDLSTATHEETPWVVARGDHGSGERSNAVIGVGEMQDYFTEQWVEQDSTGNAKIARNARAEMKRMVEDGTYGKTAVSSSELIAMLRDG